MCSPQIIYFTYPNNRACITKAAFTPYDHCQKCGKIWKKRSHQTSLATNNWHSTRGDITETGNCQIVFWILKMERVWENGGRLRGSGRATCVQYSHWATECDADNLPCVPFFTFILKLNENVADWTAGCAVFFDTTQLFGPRTLNFGRPVSVLTR